MGYASQQFLFYDASTLANFKNWAFAISTALSSSGWLQTSDTGQVNWSTIASVPATGSFVYEIWHPTDALQTGSTQYFLKVEYGAGTGSPHGPRVRFSIGTGTNGSGTLTGTLTAVFDPLGASSTGQGALVAADCYFSGDIDRFSLMMWRSFGSSVTVIPQSTNLVFALGIERTKAVNGTNSTDGVTIANWDSSNNSRGQQTLVFAASLVASPCGTAPDTGYMCAIGYSGSNTTNGYFNNQTPVFWQIPVYGFPGNPMTIFALIYISDIAEDCIFTTTLYSATRTYIASRQYTANLNGGNMASDLRLAMRFD